MIAFSSSGFSPVFTSTSTPRARKISAAWSLRLSEIRTLTMLGSRAGPSSRDADARLSLYVIACLVGDGRMPAAAQAAAASSVFTCAQAQSSQGSNASMSAVSTVAPPQIRRPGGASR